MTLNTKKLIAVGITCTALTQIGSGAKIIQYLLGIGDAAYAGQAKAKEVDEKFERYLDSQQKAQAMEQQRQALQQEFNQKLVELQQQRQATSQAAPLVYPKLPVQHRWWAQDDQGYWYWCDNPVKESCTSSDWIEE